MLSWYPCKCSCCWLVAHAHVHVHEHVHVIGELYLIAGSEILCLSDDVGVRRVWCAGVRASRVWERVLRVWERASRGRGARRAASALRACGSALRACGWERASRGWVGARFARVGARFARVGARFARARARFARKDDALRAAEASTWAPCAASSSFQPGPHSTPKCCAAQPKAAQGAKGGE